MQTKWQKVILRTQTVEPSLLDLFSHLFFEAGAIGVEVDYAQGYLENHPNLFGEIAPDPHERDLSHETEVIAFFDQEIASGDLEASIRNTVGQVDFTLEFGLQEDEQWQTKWMTYYEPQAISRYLTIVPVWMEDYQPRNRETVIFLDPGLAFGTGNHPTTQLGAQALEIVMRGDERVYDVGTGTGILSFIAKQLGAKWVKGYDLDPQAIEAAHQNLSYQTDTSGIEFGVNDLLVGVEEQAEIIVANILPHILVNMLDDAKKLLVPGGTMILGGILQEKSSDLEAILEEKGWVLVQKMWYQGWVSLIVRVKGE